MKLYEFNHETIVRAGNGSFLLYKGLGLLVIISVLENDIGDNESN